MYKHNGKATMNGTPHRTNASQRRLPLLSKGGQRCDSPWPGANALVPPPRAHARTQPGTTQAQHPPPDRPAPQRPGGGTAPPRESAKQGKGGTGGGQAARARRARKERRHNTARTTAPQHRARWGSGRGASRERMQGGGHLPPVPEEQPRTAGGSGGECPLSRQRRPPGDTGKPTTRDGPPRGGPLPAPLGPCSRGCARKAPSPEGRASVMCP